MPEPNKIHFMLRSASISSFMVHATDRSTCISLRASEAASCRFVEFALRRRALSSLSSHAPLQLSADHRPPEATITYYHINPHPASSSRNRISTQRTVSTATRIRRRRDKGNIATPRACEPNPVKLPAQVEEIEVCVCVPWCTFSSAGVRGWGAWGDISLADRGPDAARAALGVVCCRPASG